MASSSGLIEIPMDEELSNTLDRLPSCVHHDLLEGLELQGPNQDSSEKSSLPPPMLFFKFECRSKALPAPYIMQEVLTRARSNSPNRCASGRHFLLNVTKSMPNLHSNRSMHNRGIGLSVLTDSSECGCEQGKRILSSRVQEFDELLEGIDSM